MTIDAETLAVARTVRTSDLSDALDSMGLQERHQMEPRMRPLFPGIRFAGQPSLLPAVTRRLCGPTSASWRSQLSTNTTLTRPSVKLKVGRVPPSASPG